MRPGLLGEHAGIALMEDTWKSICVIALGHMYDRNRPK